MHEHITAAGFIVCSNEAIWGVGTTSDEAWNSFAKLMADNHTTIVAENDEAPDEPCTWVYERDYKIRPATEKLMTAVMYKGGNVAWDVARGVCCTVEEFEASEAEDEAAISIYTLDASDRELLDRYCAVDDALGEAFADADCSKLVPDWREIAERRIAQKREG